MTPQDAPDPLRQQSWLRLRAKRLVGGGLRNSVDPEDLVQSALREAWMRRDSLTFTHEGGLRAWLAKVLRHKAVRVSRRQRRAEHASDILSGAASPGSSPSSIVAAREEPDDLRGRLRMLDERSRRVIQLRFVDRWSFAQVAEHLSMSEANARRVFSRAIADLREAAAQSRPRHPSA